MKVVWVCGTCHGGGLASPLEQKERAKPGEWKLCKDCGGAGVPVRPGAPRA